MMTRLYAALRRCVVPLVVLLAVFDASADAPVSLRTHGGEAWTFDKMIEGTVPPGDCEIVAIRSPAGTSFVSPQGGRFAARVPLASGDNRVTAECRKGGAVQGDVAKQNWHVRLGDAPRARIKIASTSEAIRLRGGESSVAPRNGARIVRYEWRARSSNPTTIVALPAEGDELVLSQAWADGEHYVTLKVTDASGRSDESTAVFRVVNGKPDVVDPVQFRPTWIRDAVVYGVVPALFGRRGFDDVTSHIDRLAGLGVNTLWIVPVTRTSPGDFGYAVTDHFHLRADFGGPDDLRELIAAAHARNMRVIIDFVPNHMSDQHNYFVDAARNAERSAYFAYFNRTGSGEPTHYFDWRNLKNLNFGHPEVQRMLIEAFSYWVREFDVDGFRVDVAWGPRQRAPEFWPRWRAALHRIKPDLLLLAEASARDPYYLQNGFDAAYDWTDKLGQWAWHDAFGDETKTASILRAALREPTSNGPVFRFLENNDTERRFITRHGLARTKLAAALLLTLPGLPGLFTGQEVGAEYEPYKTRGALSWNDPEDLQSWYGRLIALRKQVPQLRSPDMRLISVGADEHVLAYHRGCPGRGSVIVLLNFGSRSQDIVIPADVLGDSREAFDLLNREGVTLGAKNGLTMQPLQARVLTPDGTRGSNSDCG